MRGDGRAINLLMLPIDLLVLERCNMHEHRQEDDRKYGKKWVREASLSA